MNLKSTIYWLLSILILMLCLTYSKSANDSETAEPIALTSYFKIEPNLFSYINNRFHATVLGQLRIDIETERITADITSFNALVIEEYQFKQDTQLSLNWQIKGETYQVLMNQTKHSINQIDFHTKDADEISNLHLLITTTRELGFKNNFQDSVTFQSMRLDQLHNQSQLAANFSEWDDFTAVKLSSINGYTQSTDLHYKELILRLSCWLFMAALMFWLFRIKGTHLIATLFLAWLVSSYFFLNNHIKQHQQISLAYTTEQNKINRLDQITYDLSQLISTKIKSFPTPLSGSDQLILIGANSFFKLRLKHHLQRFNLAIYINLKKILEDQAGYRFTYVLVGRQLRFCKKPNRFYWLSSQVTFIYVDDDFCLLRKK